jgi:hypothetical protein
MVKTYTNNNLKILISVTPMQPLVQGFQQFSLTDITQFSQASFSKHQTDHNMIATPQDCMRSAK